MKQEETVVKPERRKWRVFSAKEKSQAVLSLWSGRRSSSALTREMGVPWAILNLWEKRALSGMLTSLDPTWQQEETQGTKLPVRVERLMEKTLQKVHQAETVEK